MIAPLISLMQAQVFDLTKANIPACLVGSAQPDKNILARIQKGEFNLIYCCPEYLQGGHGREFLDILKNRLLMVAVDGQ